MTPFASVAMLEKLALLKMALCSASALTTDSAMCRSALSSKRLAGRFAAPVGLNELGMGHPD